MILMILLLLLSLLLLLFTTTTIIIMLYITIPKNKILLCWSYSKCFICKITTWIVYTIVHVY